MIIFHSSNAKFHHTEISDPSFIPAHLQTAKQQKLGLLYTKSMFNSLFKFSAFHYNLFFIAGKWIKMPLKTLSTSSASPSSTFYYPYLHCSYPPLQRPCHPSFLFCVLNLFTVLIPTASSTPPVHTIISFLVGRLFLFPYNNSALLISDKNLLNHSLPPSTQLQPVCILPGIYYMLSFSYILLQGFITALIAAIA